MKLGLLLIALGFGYKVYAEASKEKGKLRSIGLWVGAFMMAVSFLLSSLFVYTYSMQWMSGKCPGVGCPFDKPGCPFGNKTVSGKAPAALPPSK